MKADYKNWMPKGMVASFIGGTAGALAIMPTARLLMPSFLEQSKTKGHRSRAKSSTQLHSLQTPTTNFKVPSLPSLLTNWLQIQGFPLSPQVR